MRWGVMGILGLLTLCGCGWLGMATYLTEAELRRGFVGIWSTFTLTAQLVLLAVAGVGIMAAVAGVAVVWGKAWDKLSDWQLERSRKRAEVEQAEALAKSAERDATVRHIVADAGQQVYREKLDIVDGEYRITTDPLHLIPGRLNGEVQQPRLEDEQRWDNFHTLHASASPQIVRESAPLQLPPVTGPIDLLAELDSVQRCLIVGASDSGKTTLLQHIMARRLINSRVVAIDPHAAPNKWPAHKVFGVGRDYASIEWGLDELIRLMIKRYDDIGAGRVPEMGHSKVTVLVDEWRAIIQNVDNASGAIKTLLTESRKAAFSVFVATHSERVKALGIEGEGDLKDGFAVVRLQVVNGQRVATLDKGAGAVEVQLPGPLTAWVQPRQIEARVTEPEPVEPDGKEREILRLFDEGVSVTAIARQVIYVDEHGQPKGKNPAQSHIEQVREVLRKFGRLGLTN